VLKCLNRKEITFNIKIKLENKIKNPHIIIVKISTKKIVRFDKKASISIAISTIIFN
jgi:hypothetical protein